MKKADQIRMDRSKGNGHGEVAESVPKIG